MKREWVDSKCVEDHPAPKQETSDKVKREYAHELARRQFAFKASLYTHCLHRTYQMQQRKRGDL